MMTQKPNDPKPKRKLKNQHPETMPLKAIMTQKTN